MRGETLGNLRGMLKAECRFDQATTSEDIALNLLIANKQKFLASDMDWPFLQHHWDLQIAGGSRYVTLPTTDEEGATVAINFEREPKVEVWYNSAWQDVDYGIGADEYNYTDSDSIPGHVAVSLDPIERWQFYTDVSETSQANQIEVWPIPATAQGLRFTCTRDLFPLFNVGDITSYTGGGITTIDARKADLDDMLLVLSVAAEKLKSMDRPDWQDKAALAKSRLDKVKAVYPNRERPCVLGRGTRDMSHYRHLVPLLIAGKH